MDTVSVIIATFGDRHPWNELAMRAVHSVAHQSHPPDELIRVHKDSLAHARNHGAMMSSSTWLCFLDADDELEPKYLEEMLRAPAGDLRYPLVHIAGADVPKNLYIGRPLIEGNYLPIGTLVRRNLFMEVKGFQHYPMYEDWALWLRCEEYGARPQLVPGAVYRAHRNQNGRNGRVNPRIAIEVREDFLAWKRLR